MTKRIKKDKDKIEKAKNRESKKNKKTQTKNINRKENKNLKITEKKIKKLLDFEHLEELYFILHLLNDKQIESFINHYKNFKIKNSKDQKIDALIKRSKTSSELFDLVKLELIKSKKEEYIKIKQEISGLRKKGFDVYIEDIKLMSVPLKIKIFDATSDKKDLYRINKIIIDIESSLTSKKIEIENNNKQKELIRKEVNKIKGHRKKEEKNGNNKRT